jgi:SP family general alpha glucoside:H+ symporter-like MFS transporter
MEAKNASYADCFRGENKRRTMIVSMAWLIQIFNGQSITNYAATMLRAIGMSANDAFSYTMGIQSVNIFATAIAIALMGTVGRRTFYLYGSASIGLCMLVVGILGFAIKSASQVAIPVAVFLIFVQIAFKISLGPTTYVIAGEMASSRVRAQTIVIGRALYVCGQIAVQQLNPRMLNNDPTAWNWGAKTGMFYFGFCLIWVIWIFFFLPETKDRSFAEIDYLFKKRTPARKFRGAAVDRKLQCPSSCCFFVANLLSKSLSSCRMTSSKGTLAETIKASNISRLPAMMRSALLDGPGLLSFVFLLRYRYG